MNQYERRFYEDIHKLVLIQKDILKELKKMNEPIIEYKEKPKEQEITIEEIQKLIYCIDLIIQNFGENKELEDLADKLIKIKEEVIR